MPTNIIEVLTIQFTKLEFDTFRLEFDLRYILHCQFGALTVRYLELFCCSKPVNMFCEY